MGVAITCVALSVGNTYNDPQWSSSKWSQKIMSINELSENIGVLSYGR
jgi:hypothetical protein